MNWRIEHMLKINEKLYNKMPEEYKRYFAILPNPSKDEVVELFPKEAGGGNGLPRVETTGDSTKSKTEGFGIGRPIGFETQQYADKGSAARFFYCPKASKEERNMGLYGFEEDTTDDGREKSIDNAFQRGKTMRRNIHPTVKPIDLMRYLCRLITPKDGIVLDPYLGSGSTAIAAKKEKFRYIGIEREKDYVDISEARIKATVVEYDIFDYI